MIQNNVRLGPVTTALRITRLLTEGRSVAWKKFADGSKHPPTSFLMVTWQQTQWICFYKSGRCQIPEAIIFRKLYTVGVKNEHFFPDLVGHSEFFYVYWTPLFLHMCCNTYVAQLSDKTSSVCVYLTQIKRASRIFVIKSFYLWRDGN
jgi:hypothetical protein